MSKVEKYLDKCSWSRDGSVLVQNFLINMRRIILKAGEVSAIVKQMFKKEAYLFVVCVV
jgi:hypothetical protein